MAGWLGLELIKLSDILSDPSSILDLPVDIDDILIVIQTIFIIIGVMLTVLTLFSTKKDHKRRATLDLILSQRADKQLHWATKLMSQLVNKQKNEEYSDLSDYLKVDGPERKAISTVLNHREFVSVGINKGIIDEEIYKQAYYTMFVRDWKYLKNTINTIRNKDEKNKTFFQDFEKLAKKWSKKSLDKY